MKFESRRSLYYFLSAVVYALIFGFFVAAEMYILANTLDDRSISKWIIAISIIPATAIVYFIFSRYCNKKKLAHGNIYCASEVKNATVLFFGIGSLSLISSVFLFGEKIGF